MRRLFLPILAVLTACGDTAAPNDRSSFERLQTEILDVACISCHTDGASFASESGLVLDAGVAYDNLVSAAPTHPNAQADGLLRVTPGVAQQSLLLYKLHWEPDYAPNDYGGPMPLGSQSLSVGQIEFVRRWIVAGAPRDADVVDPALLEDATLPDLTPFVPPAPPPTGVQLTTGQFGIDPTFEREIFLFRDVGNTEPLFVNQIDVAMRPNSHHFVMYGLLEGTPNDAVPPLDVIRDLRTTGGALIPSTLKTMPYHVFFGGAMTTEASWVFPYGVALELPVGARLDLNSHYVNRTEAEMRGEVYANLHTVDAASVQHVARNVNFGNFDIALPPGERTTQRKTFTMADTTHVFMLTSHMHKRGERFVIRIAGGSRDGEVIYETEHWDHPDIVSYDPAILLLPGEGLTSEITWFNETDRTITFGLTSEDEMGIIFGYRY
jgi:hypothetical protein